jgi:hypothetical protein
LVLSIAKIKKNIDRSLVYAIFTCSLLFKRNFSAGWNNDQWTSSAIFLIGYHGDMPGIKLMLHPPLPAA